MSDHIRDPIDDAIDRVASNLVSVNHDDDAVQRIVSSLPERPARGWWNMPSLAVQAAALAVVAVTVFVVRTSNRDEVPLLTVSLPPSALPSTFLDARPIASIVGLPLVAVRDAMDKRSLPAISSINANVQEPPSFGLPAIAAIGQLNLSDLRETAPLAAVEPALVVPIALGDLPLAGDTPTPFSKE